MVDSRNVTDEFKEESHEKIVAALDARGVEFEIAIENTLRDYNMGTIVRSANAFGVRRIHVVGRRQWNKRGAMMTDKYLEVLYHDSPEHFVRQMHKHGLSVVAIDNVHGATLLQGTEIGRQVVLVFGQEGPGISTAFLEHCDQIVAIEQLGSTRSVNVGVAAGIAMYEILRRNYLPPAYACKQGPYV